jgi:FkbM family methyltransferase
VKDSLKYILQKSLGFKNYLYVFALFKIKTLKQDSKEKDFFYFMDLLYDDKGIVLDIGANIGIMSYHLAKNLPNTSIHAFEPIPVNISILKKIIAKFHLKNIKLHEIALGEKKGHVQMVLPERNKVVFQGLSHVKHESITEMNEGKEFDVEIDSLDNLFKGELIQAIKIDVENFEYFVLKGAERILNANKPIIYAELWDNLNRINCFNLLLSIDYAVFVVEKNQLIGYDEKIHNKQNFIFIAN